MQKLLHCFTTKSKILNLTKLDSNLFYYSTVSDGIKIFSSPESKIIKNIQIENFNAISSLISMSSDAKFIAYSNKNKINIISIETNKIINSIDIDSEVTAINFDISNTYLFVGTSNGGIYQYRYNNNLQLSDLYRFSKNKNNAINIISSYDTKIFLADKYGSLSIVDIYTCKIQELYLKSRLKAELAGWMGVLLPLGFMELIYRAVFSGSFGVYTVPSYFFHLAHKFSAEGHINFVNLDFYPWMYSRVEGWFVLGIAASAILWNFRPLKIDRILISLSVFAPVILFSLAEERLARAITVVLPWISVCIGIMIADLWKNSWTRILSICIACIMIWSATIHIPPVLQIRSGYSQAIDWIQSQGHGTGHFSTMMPVSAFLVGERSQGCPPPLLRYLKFGTQGDLGTPDPGQGLLSQCAIYPPATLRELSLAARILGFRYLLTDWQKHVAFHPSILEIETNCAPVAIFDNPMVQYPTVLHENYLPEDAEELPKWDPSVYKILIFDLDTCLPDIESSL